MNYVRKMVLEALEDEKLCALVLMSFDTYCLPSYKDYDWCDEMNKVNFVREVLKREDKKAAKRLFLKRAADKSSWQDEYQKQAKKILERWRKMR